jgi:hypothetical protein
MSDLTVHTPAQNAQLDPMTVAKVFRASGMFPDIQSEAAACAKLIIGRGLGLADYDAMSGLHIIKGKAVLAANLMAAAIKRSGKYDYRATCTDTECRIEFLGRDGGKWKPIGETSFTLEDAKRAGLGGDNWRKYPKAMLFARCISAGYKQHCPDALGAAPVYVESHGETEITEDAPPPPRKALPTPAAPTREERRADTEALLSPVPQAERAPEPHGGGTLTLVARGWQASAVKRPNGTTIFRVDVDGCDAPFAVLDCDLMHSLEAESAFGHTIEVRWKLTAEGKRVITGVADA